MKIMMIGQLIGGLDSYIRNVIEYTDDRFEFVIVTGKTDNHKPIVRRGAIVKEYCVDMFRALNPQKDLRCLLDTIRIIRRENPDIIHCHSAKGGVIGRIAGKLTKKKTFYTPHAFSFLSAQSGIKRQIYLFFERICRFDSFVLACSNSEKTIAIEQVGYRTSHAMVWNNAVPDASDVEPAPLDYPAICYIGRPSYQKNPQFFVELAKRVHTKHPEIKFYLLGVGYYSPDLGAVESLVKAYQLEDTVILKPWLSHAETMAIVKSCLFYLTVSRYEGLPLAVIEAMSLGKAIVASNVWGNMDCVADGYNGRLLPLELDVFTDTLLTLIEDKELRDTYSRHSRERFEQQFLITRQIKNLEAIYES